MIKTQAIFRSFRNIRLHHCTKVSHELNMSAIVSSILNSTIGLLCSKLRDYTANRLNEGDVTDDQCREIIVRELDDIKSKLDGLSRKDLLASLSFFKEGVTRLYMSLETSDESCDEPSTSNAAIQDKAEVEGTTAAAKVEQFPPMQTERDVFEKVLELSEAIGNLKIGSQDRYENAKTSFREALRLATEAFNNEALSTEERIMAGKLRIASSILGGLDDLEAAIQDCLLYLKELQDLPAIGTMFSVLLDSEKGITSLLRARFNQQKRNDNIESIQLINALLFDLTVKFTEMTVALFSWPKIMIGTRFYYPLLNDPVIVRKIEKEGALRSCAWKFNEGIDVDRCALTSKGEILSIVEEGLEITRRSGKSDTFRLIPSERHKTICVAVDDNDNIYIAIKNEKCKLLILDATGNTKAERFTEISCGLCLTQINVTKDGSMVAILADDLPFTHTLYICDSTNTEPDYELPFPFKETSCQPSFTFSNNNEIIFIDNNPAFFNMYIVTMDGKLKQSVRLLYETTVNGVYFFESSVVVNHVNDTILVSVNEVRRGEDPQRSSKTTICTLSKTGELLHQFKIQGRYPRLISHPSGPIALINDNEAIMLQTLT